MDKVRFKARIGDMVIDIQCLAESPQADALRYLKEPLVQKQEALHLAITAMYAAEGARLRRASNEEILYCLQLADEIYQRQRRYTFTKLKIMHPDIDLSLLEQPAIAQAQAYAVNGSNNGSALDESEGEIANSYDDQIDDPLAGGNTADLNEESNVFQE